MAYTRVVNLASRNLFDGSLRHARRFRNLRPPALRSFKSRDHVVMHVERHTRKHRPIFGFTQPTFGSSPHLACNPMKGQKKTPKLPGFMRIVVAENVKALMALKFPDSLNQPKALADATGKPKEGGQSLSTVQRILKGESGASLDTLEAIADALDVSLYQLLIPALDTKNPQIVQGATEAEEKMYRRWRRSEVGRQPASQPELRRTE